jgi:hypothetical protein
MPPDALLRPDAGLSARGVDVSGILNGALTATSEPGSAGPPRRIQQAQLQQRKAVLQQELA